VYDNRDHRAILFRVTGSVVLSRRVLIPSILSSVMCVVIFQASEGESWLGDQLEWPAWVYSTAVAFAIIFRVDLAYRRYWTGVTSATMMLSMWRNAYSNTVAFIDVSLEEFQRQKDTKRAEELQESKELLLHWFSVLFAIAVQTLQWREEPNVLRPYTPASDAPKHQNSATWAMFSESDTLERIFIHGETSRMERDALEDAFDKLTHVMQWITMEVSNLHLFGLVLIPSPILSRVYEDLSSGALAYCEAHTIAFIPFPFLFAQVLTYLLSIFYVLCPLIVQASLSIGGEELRHSPWSWPVIMCMNWLLVIGYTTLNEIAIVLEAPFAEDVNNFPIRAWQHRVDRSIEHVAGVGTPNDFSIAGFGLESEMYLHAVEEEAWRRALDIHPPAEASPTEPAAAITPTAAAEEFRYTIARSVRSLVTDQSRLQELVQHLETQACELGCDILSSQLQVQGGYDSNSHYQEIQQLVPFLKEAATASRRLSPLLIKMLWLGDESWRSTKAPTTSAQDALVMSPVP